MATTIFLKFLHALKNSQKVKNRFNNWCIPPCQAYSLIGRHQDEIENDPRNKLYIQYGRFLKEFTPDYFVFENVPGLLSAGNGSHFKKPKKIFQKMIRIRFKKYSIRLTLVFTKQKRVIIIGWKKEINFSYPEFDIESKLYKNKTFIRGFKTIKAWRKI